MHKIMFINGEPGAPLNWTSSIESLGHDFKVVSSMEQAVESFVVYEPTCVILRCVSSSSPCLDVISAIKSRNENTPIFIFSPITEVDFVVKTIRAGVLHYYECPHDENGLIEIINKLLKEVDDLFKQKTNRQPKMQKLPGVVGESEANEKIANRVFKIAPLDVNVMIWGETGTGKELIAQSIHAFSERSDKPFIAIDCVSLPPNLIESEIFGHEQGAFTGANKTKKGLLELAHGGTLFLDEITELDIYLQGKLLRVLQERQFRRVGGNKVIDVDIRILSATNMDPERAVAQNKLRQDLYYRLNVVPLHLLPLRERKNDIVFLAEHFIDELNKFSKVEVKGFTRRAMSALVKYDWPGNVRELQNVVLQAVALSESDIIDISDLPDTFQIQNTAATEHAVEQMNFKQAKELHMRQFCQAYFDEILEKYQGNISEVAREAELSRGTIYKIFKDFDIESPHLSAR